MSFPLKRAFIALPLEGEAKEKLRELQIRFQAYDDMLRFQNPETAHLTLYFWQELMEIEYEDMVKRVAKIAERTSPFTLKVLAAETSIDPKTKLDRVLWLTIVRSEGLAKLKKLCPWPNIQPFSPHITVARISKPHDFIIHKKKIMKLLKNVSFDIPVDRIRLFAEIECEKQTPLRDFPLIQSSSTSIFFHLRQ